MSKRVLLDANIIEQREKNCAQKSSIVQLFNWLNRLKYDKWVHQKTIHDGVGYGNVVNGGILLKEITSYSVTDFIPIFDDKFANIVKEYDGDNKNEVGNLLLNGVYCGLFDLLITEDLNIVKKAEALGISHKVLTIDDFIYQCCTEYPSLIEYKFGMVHQKMFSDVDLHDGLFDSLRNSYKGFDDWYNKKKDETVYVNYDKDNKLRGFLYLKQETQDENYSDIEPVFKPAKRLKIGTFKVDATGYRLGERFLQIIFDNAIETNVDEIYVTMYDSDDIVKQLKQLFLDWGFAYHGVKSVPGCKSESVYVKKMKCYDASRSIVENFPNVNYKVKKYFLPILPKYHTQIFPDAILRTEGNTKFDDYNANRYSLEKCYISFTYKTDFKIGDIVVIYRNGENEGRKGFDSVITSICVISNILYSNQIKNKDQMLNFCKNRSVFNEREIIGFYNKKNRQLIKMILIKPLNKKVILKSLWENCIVTPPNGPRPFDEISDDSFKKILKLSDTKLYEV